MHLREFRVRILWTAKKTLLAAGAAMFSGMCLTRNVCSVKCHCAQTIQMQKRYLNYIFAIQLKYTYTLPVTSIIMHCSNVIDALFVMTKIGGVVFTTLVDTQTDELPRLPTLTGA